MYFFQLDNLTYTAAMESESFDIDKFLPIKSSAEAELFCCDDDGLFDLRKKAASRRVYSAADLNSMTAFVASVSDIFFHGSFQISHRWPAKQ